MYIQVVYLLAGLLTIFADSDKDYTYEDLDAWGEISKTCTSGRAQSPVSIPVMGLDKADFCLKYTNYDATLNNVTISNTGHTVSLSYKDKTKPTITIEGSSQIKNGEYEVLGYHYHWAESNYNGSEHKVTHYGFALSFAAEGHLVHKNKKYETVQEAMKNPDGLLVVGFPYDESSEKSDLKGISDLLPKIVNPGSKVAVPPINLKDRGLVCDQTFYSYSGSLTTPPCSESVQWILCYKNRYATKEDMEKFRKIKLNNGDTNNIRPVQQLNDRDIYKGECNK